MEKFRPAALFLTLAMLLCALPVSAAESNWLVPKAKNYAGFADMKGAWCESYVETVYEAGLMEGKSASSFDINSNLTIAQITVITARLHSLLNGGNGVLPAPGEGEEWYRPAIDYLKAHVDDANGIGPMLGTRIVQMEAAPAYADQRAPRQDLVSFLSPVLPDTALAPINHITALPDTQDEDDLRFYNAGILNGVDEYGTFLGNKPLTRGAAAAILARVIDPSLRLTFTVKPFDLCRDMLGVESDTVFLTVDGAAVTAGQIARPLCGALQGRDPLTSEKFFTADLEGIRTRTVAAIKHDLAMDRLLADKLLKPDVIDSSTLSPYYGMSLDGCLWEKVHMNAYDLLLEFYEAEQGGSQLGLSPDAMHFIDGREALEHDLLQLADAMKVQETPAFAELDLTAVQSRLSSLSFANAL